MPTTGQIIVITYVTTLQFKVLRQRLCGSVWQGYFCFLWKYVKILINHHNYFQQEKKSKKRKKKRNTNSVTPSKVNRNWMIYTYFWFIITSLHIHLYVFTVASHFTAFCRTFGFRSYLGEKKMCPVVSKVTLGGASG